MLNERSMATTQRARPRRRVRYGRANAAASSSSAATRAASSRRSRSRRRRDALDRRAVQQPHGRERHFRRDVAPQQVQDDRDRDREGAEQERGIEERHPYFRRARADEIAEQREVERLRRVELHVVDARAAQLAVVARASAPPAPADTRCESLAGSAVTSSALSTILEPRRTVERKRQLVRIQDLKDDDVVAAGLEVLAAP